MEQKTYFFMPGLLLIILLLFIGCEGDIAAVGEDAYGPVEDAVVAVSVEWPDDAGGAMHAGANDDDSSAARMTASPVRLSDDCEGRGVDKVRVSIQSSAGSALKSATFDCRAGQGTLRGLEPQSNCRIVVSALDFNGNVTYEGRKTGVSLRSGMNNIGTVLVERVQASSITYMNKTASLDDLIIDHYSVSNGVYNIDLIIEGPEAEIYLEMFFPSDFVSSGAYYWSPDESPGTFSDFSDICMHNECDGLIDGIVIIERTGSEYTIEGFVETVQDYASFYYTGPGTVY